LTVHRKLKAPTVGETLADETLRNLLTIDVFPTPLSPTVTTFRLESIANFLTRPIESSQ
jgi:hypothetical protein